MNSNFCAHHGVPNEVYQNAEKWRQLTDAAPFSGEIREQLLEFTGAPDTGLPPMRDTERSRELARRLGFMPKIAAYKSGETSVVDEPGAEFPQKNSHPLDKVAKELKRHDARQPMSDGFKVSLPLPSDPCKSTRPRLIIIGNNRAAVFEDASIHARAFDGVQHRLAWTPVALFFNDPVQTDLYKKLMAKPGAWVCEDSLMAGHNLTRQEIADAVNTLVQKLNGGFPWLLPVFTETNPRDGKRYYAMKLCEVSYGSQFWSGNIMDPHPDAFK